MGAFEVVGTGLLPVVVHVPHAGLAVPDDVRAGIALDDESLDAELRRMTDHRTDLLAAGAIAAGARAVVNRVSRLVVDPERFLDPDREAMEAVGMGAVYTRTADGEVLRRPSSGERAALIQRFFEPYHRALTQVVDDALERHGRVVLVDLHSYPSSRLPYEIGGEERPQLCVGTDEHHTPSWLVDVAVGVGRARGWTVALDTPFAGTFVPTEHLGRDDVLSVMLELRRDLHLDEQAWEPHAGEPDVADAVTAVVLEAADRVARGR